MARKRCTAAAGSELAPVGRELATVGSELAPVGRVLLFLCLPVLCLCGPVSVTSSAPLPAPAPAPRTAPALPPGDGGGCVIGTTRYTVGAEVRGAARAACERCVCEAGGGLACGRKVCEPRPGCKALQRSDQCCPTYQCDCERDGVRYANGEKVIEATDPCQVCYCQGGEVVCRRIACFVRTDCEPRVVPGRCCPEYHNCPLRGTSDRSNTSTTVRALLDYTSTTTHIPTSNDNKNKQEITIKEVTSTSHISNLELKEKLSPERSHSTITLLPSSTPGVNDTKVIASNSSSYVSSTSPSDTVPITSQKVLVENDTVFTTASNHLMTSTTIPALTVDTRVDTSDDDIPPEFQNPAFPPLPDDFSQPTQDDSEPTHYTPSNSPIQDNNSKSHLNNSSDGDATIAADTFTETEHSPSTSAGIIIKEIFSKENKLTTPSTDYKLSSSHSTSFFRNDNASHKETADVYETSKNKPVDSPISPNQPTHIRTTTSNTPRARVTTSKNELENSTSTAQSNKSLLNASTSPNMISTSSPTIINKSADSAETINHNSHTAIFTTNLPTASYPTLPSKLVDSGSASANKRTDADSNFPIDNDRSITTIRSDSNTLGIYPTDGGINSSSIKPSDTILTSPYSIHNDSRRYYNLETATATAESIRQSFTSSESPSKYFNSSIVTTTSKIGGITPVSSTDKTLPIQSVVNKSKSITETSTELSANGRSPTTSVTDISTKWLSTASASTPTATTEPGSPSSQPSLPPVINNNNVLFDLIKLVGDVASIGSGEHAESGRAAQETRPVEQQTRERRRTP